MDEENKKPFNDAIEHLQRIEGMPSNKVELNKLPKPIRYLGYFFISFIILSAVLMLIGSFFL